MKAFKGYTTRQVVDSNGNAYLRVVATDPNTVPTTFTDGTSPVVIVTSVVQTFDVDIEISTDGNMLLDEFNNQYLKITSIG